MFVTVMPFLFNVDNSLCFSKYAENIALEQKKMYRHIKYPYHEILNQIKSEHNFSGSLYDIVFSYQNTNIPDFCKWLPNYSQVESLQIHIKNLNEEKNSLSIHYDYLTDIFSELDIDNMHNRILNIISQALNNKNILVSDFEIVNNAEKKFLLYDFNNTKVPYPNLSNIVKEFEKTAKKFPQKIAVSSSKESLTYKELNNRANIVAKKILSTNIETNIIAFSLKRSISLYVTILGILKSGHTYMPIDPDYPIDRINFMLKNSGTKILITTKDFLDNIKFSGNIIDFDSLSFTTSEKNLNIEISPDKLAYIMYTSGSTGIPKAVAIKHYNVLNFEIFNSIIKSDYKMSYDKVNNILLGKEYDYNYLPFYQMLFSMQKLSNIIQNNRIENGALFLQTSELNFNVDEFSNPISIEENEKGPAQSMIENFMIIANKTVADYAYYLDLPFVYRNHEQLTNIEIDKLKSNLKREKILINKLHSLSNPNILKKVLVNILSNISKEEATYVSEIVLKSMTRAYYDSKSIGHYGLGLDRYATFTSPIRRAPDLLNHYVLNAIINYDEESEVILNILRKKLPKICDHLTERQIAAETVEKETSYVMLKELSNISVSGKLSQVIKNCAFIKIEDSVMGLIHANDRYLIDLKKQCLIDKRENITYNIDDIISLKICSEKNIGSFIPLEIESKKSKNLIKRRDEI